MIISSSQKSIRIDALIDSGADYCLFHHQLGVRIGLDVEDGQLVTMSGIEGTRIPVWLHKITIQIIGIDIQTEIIAGFTECPGVSAILGQEGFFDNFRIKFEKDHNIIEITPVKRK